MNLQNSASAHSQLAAGLIKLHRTIGPKYRWHRDNFTGSSKQLNSSCESWLEFFKEHRLRYQLNVAYNKGYRGNVYSNGIEVIENISKFLEIHQPPPSLLHGDLWAGNYGFCDGVPVVFDPAVYYGDRETDLAMMKLFGGFSEQVFRQ